MNARDAPVWPEIRNDISGRAFASSMASQALGMRALLALLLCAGCASSWPPQGQGGMAEAHFSAALIAPAPPEALQAHMRCSFGRLDAVQHAAQQAGTWSGQIEQLDLIANRARREVVGGLFSDAANTLDGLDAEIARFRTAFGLPAGEECA